MPGFPTRTHTELKHEPGYLSVIPLYVSVTSLIPYIDDATTYANLIFCPDGFYISFDDENECFNMRLI